MKIGDRVQVIKSIGDHLVGKVGTIAEKGPHQYKGEVTVRLDFDPNQNYYFFPSKLRLLPKEKDSERHPNSQRFHELLAELGELHDRKQQDYGRGDDPFANVRSSTEWGVPAWVGAMVRANDKVRRLQSLIQNGKLENESAEDSLRDLAVYAVIALVLYEQEQEAA